MTDTEQQTNQINEPIGLARAQVIIWLGLVIALAAIAGVMAVRMAEAEYRRDVRQWEIRMGITADIRSAAVQEWVTQQQDELAAIAGNTSLRLYLTELVEAHEAGEPADSDAAEAQYLHNYIMDAARKGGFLDDSRPELAPANVEYHGQAGIALLDVAGRAVVTTPAMPVLNDALKQAISVAPRAQASMKDIYLNAQGKPVLMFMVPVFAVQGEETVESQIGTIVGIRRVDALYALLQRPPTIEKTSETLLVRVAGGVAEYISPLADGTAPLKRSLDMATDAGYDVKYALEQPGRFGIKRDYASTQVLMTSREIAGTPWLLVHKIDRKEAMEESDQRRVGMITLSLLGIGFMVVVILAVWRHGSSIRYKHMATRFKSQERLLRLVTDNQPDVMFILDKDNRYRFANLMAAKEAESTKEDMLGKTVSAVLGAAHAQDFGVAVEHVLGNHEKMTHVRRVADESGALKKVLQSSYIPLARVPRVLTGGEVPGVLVVEQDITAAISERERRERLLNELVETLVMVVDKRDKYSSFHSQKVAIVAVAVASEMRLDEVSVDTVRQAALLMNLGKVMLPVALLTKKTKLTAEEKQQITDAVATTADYLHDLEFNGPVVETIRQAQERWDGSGPLRLKGDKILITAQVIALANDFVAMISPRAYRKGLEQEKVMQQFLEESGDRYQRKVVVALVNYLENNDDALAGLPAEDA